jgi:hypothetical protein
VKIEQILSASDLKRAQETIRRYGGGTDSPQTLSGLMDAWHGLVHAVANGDNWTLAAYNKGLRTRDVIEEINEGLSSDGRRTLRSALGNSDKAFISATYDPLRPSSGDVPETEIGWWQYRIPRDPKGDLELGIPELGMGVEPPCESCGELPMNEVAPY